MGEVVLLELRGEVARVGGAAAAARAGLLARPLHLAAQHAADYHIKQRRSATKAPADAATAPAPAVIDVPEAPAGAPGVNAPSPAAAADAPSDSFKRTAAAAGRGRAQGRRPAARPELAAVVPARRGQCPRGGHPHAGDRARGAAPQRVARRAGEPDGRAAREHRDRPRE